MKTLSEVVSWLSTDAPRLILVEVSGVLDSEGSALPSDILLSNLPYATQPTDTPSNTLYLPIVSGGISFTQSLSLEGEASIGYGDIELDNTDGEYDYLLKYMWTNRNIHIYIGDLSWAKSDMYPILSGTIIDIASREATKINLVLGDRLQKLNVPISEKVITNSLTRNETLIPLVLGECFNTTPINTNVIPNSLEYKSSVGPINGLIEVRDSGVPVPYTENSTTSTFNLTYTPFGQVTCSVQGYIGPYGYKNTVAGIIKTVLTDHTFGNENSVLTLSELDVSNFNTFETDFPYPVGILCQNRENILDVCNELAKSINSRLIATSTGVFKLVRLCAPQEAYSLGLGQHHEITEADILMDSLSISEKVPVKAAFKLGYCKNWTVQSSGLATGLPTSTLDILSAETKKAHDGSDSAAKNYKLNAEPEEVVTLLLTPAGCAHKMSTDMALWTTARYMYSLECFADKLNVELGDTVTLYHTRYGLAGGRIGLVVSVEKNWIDGKVTLGILV